MLNYKEASAVARHIIKFISDDTFSKRSKLVKELIDSNELELLAKNVKYTFKVLAPLEISIDGKDFCITKKDSLESITTNLAWSIASERIQPVSINTSDLVDEIMVMSNDYSVSTITSQLKEKYASQNISEARVDSEPK